MQTKTDATEIPFLPQLPYHTLCPHVSEPCSSYDRNGITGNLEWIVPNGYRSSGEGNSDHSSDTTEMAHATNSFLHSWVWLPLNQFVMETSGFEGTSTLVSVGHLGCMHLEKTVIQIISKISLHIETYRHTEKFPLWGDICSDFISSDLFGGRGEENRPHSSVEIWAPATWPVSFGTVIWPLLYIDPVRRSHGGGRR